MYSLLITFALVAIITSFLCSLWEAVLLSITPAYAQIKIKEGAHIGHKLEHFKSNIDKPLAAILTLNTIAHTIGAIGVGNEAARIWQETSPLITGFIVPVTMTAAVLILSEIIPKTIGANFWRVLAPFTVTCLSFILFILAPLVWMCQLITKGLRAKKGESIFSRSDFLAMTELGEAEGVFQKEETEVIKNLIHFDKFTVRDIMTPRVVVHAAPEELSIKDFYDNDDKLSFSRIPLYQDQQKDSIVGYALKDDILEEIVEGRGDHPLRSIKRDIIVTLKSQKVPALFNQLVKNREHIALVVDEFGGMSGIVTMEDIFETLLGMEIVDESDDSTDMQLLARKRWHARAKVMGLDPDSIEHDLQQ